MFNANVIHPVDYFNNTLVTTLDKNIDDLFKQEILGKSKIDIAANKATANEIRSLDSKINKLSKSANTAKGGMFFLRGFGIVLLLVGILFIVLGSLKYANPPGAWIGGGAVGVVLGATIFGLSWLVKKRFQNFEKILVDTRKEREEQFSVAMSQLADFQSKFYGDMVFEIFEKTYPLINFADYFSHNDYLNWTLWLQDDVNSSALYCLSGDLNTNPFIVLRTRNTKLFDKTYTGSVTRMVRRSTYVNGRWTTTVVPKVITAATTNPAPTYWNETKLFFKSNVAADLTFSNMSAFKNEKKAAKFYRKDKDMESMENPEFDKLFPCQRDDEVQFRTLFSPLAQEEMVKLLKVKNDYNFYKNKSLNVISSGTFNGINMDYNFDRYYSMFDYEDIKNDFYTFNQSFFKNIYFMFAPILTIPIYIQSRYRQSMEEKAKIRLMSYMESESIANTSFGQAKFGHPNSKTESILKTHPVFANSEYEINEIIAHGYDTKSRVVVITVMDSEAGATPVPITVIDYLPIKQSTYVSNALAKNIKKDFSGVFAPFKSIWEKYSKSLGATAIGKHGNIISMILNQNKPVNNPDTYKKFLDELSKSIGQ